MASKGAGSAGMAAAPMAGSDVSGGGRGGSIGPVKQDERPRERKGWGRKGD